MDRTGCSELLASDSFVIKPGTPTCDTNLPGYGIWIASMALIKLFATLGLIYDWYDRYVRRNGENKKGPTRLTRRLPVVPLFTSLQCTLVLLAAALTTSGICTSQNGCGLAIASTFFALFDCYSLLLLRKFISLGKTMIPVARMRLRDTEEMAQGIANGESSKTEDSSINPDRFSKEDTSLRIIIGIHILLLIAQWIIAVPIQLSINRTEYELFVTITFGAFAACITMSATAYLVQFERLIRATKAGCAKPYRDDVKKALHKMRRMEVIYIVLHAFCIALALLVCIRIVPPAWYIILSLLTIEVGATTLTFAYLRLRRKRKIDSKRIVGALVSDSSSMLVVSRGAI